jgi:hypothetical protein
MIPSRQEPFFWHVKEVEMTADGTVLSLTDDQRRNVMKASDVLSAMLRLKALGWGSKRIAAELSARAVWCIAGWLRAIGGMCDGEAVEEAGWIVRLVSPPCRQRRCG